MTFGPNCDQLLDHRLINFLVRIVSTFNSEVGQHSTKCRHRQAPHAASLARWVQLVVWGSPNVASGAQMLLRRAWVPVALCPSPSTHPQGPWASNPLCMAVSTHPVANHPASSALTMCLHSDNRMVPRTRLSIPRAGAGYSGKPGGFTSNLRLTWHWARHTSGRHHAFLQ